MTLVFWFFVVPLVLAALVLGAMTIYRRYKDNQLSAHMQERLEEAVEEILDEVMPESKEVPRCGFRPSLAGYGPCERPEGHEGPCAHDWEASKSDKKEVISMADAQAQFDTFKREELAKIPAPPVVRDKYGYPESSYEGTVRECTAHNIAHERLSSWLQDKETRTFGNQVCDPLAQIGTRKIPKKPLPKPKIVEQEVIMPNKLVTFMGNNHLNEENVISLALQAIGMKEAEGSPMAERIRKNAVEKALKEERQKYAAQLKEIEAKVKQEKEDDAFHLKVVSEEKARLETEVASLKEKLSEKTCSDGVVDAAVPIPYMTYEQILSEVEKNGASHVEEIVKKRQAQRKKVVKKTKRKR